MTPLETALDLLDRGYWPVPLHAPGTPLGRAGDGKIAFGKEPIGSGWGLKQPTVTSLRLAYAAHPGAGVGLKLGPDCGPGGTPLIDLEIDGPKGEDSLLTLLGGESVETMGWRSAKGLHRLFTLDDDDAARWDSLPAVVRLAALPDLEIRLGNGKQIQSACPPTTTSDGFRREWFNQGPPALLPPGVVGRYFSLASKPAESTTKPVHLNVLLNKPISHGGTILEVSTPERAWYLSAIRREAETVAATPEGSHNRRNALNRAAFTLGGHLHHGGLSEEEVARELLSASRYNGLPEAEALDTIRRALNDGRAKPLPAPDALQKKTTSQPPERNGHHHDDDDDADAKILEGIPRNGVAVGPARHRMLAETLAILARDSGWFVRGEQLVRVIVEADDESSLPQKVKLKQAKGTARVVPLVDSVLACLISEFVFFYRIEIDKEKGRIIHRMNPPATFISGLVACGDYPGIRPLVALAEAPFPRFDGSIVSDPGYDSDTGVYLSPYPRLDSIPERPTREDARQAAGVLFDLVRQFPFVSDDDKIVWLTGLLTVVARPGINGPVPGIAIIGNRAGTGKGRLVDLIGVIARGRALPTMSYPSQQEEAEKQKLSIALSGVALVHFDNLGEGTFYGNGPLDSALTSSTVSGRILGQSRYTDAIPLRTAWFLTGNGISPGKDAYRRWLPCSLVTHLENPEERDDIEESNILDHAESRRSELLRAALVILTAHARAGRPSHGKPPLGSFEEWDSVVRGAVWYATGRDAIATRRIAADEAPERLQRLALLQAWSTLTHGAHGDGGLTCAEVLRIALKYETDPTALGVHDALVAFTRDGKLPSVHAIGCILRAMKGRVIDGLMFESVGMKRCSALWRVQKANQPATEVDVEAIREREAIRNERDLKPVYYTRTNDDGTTEDRVVFTM